MLWRLEPFCSYSNSLPFSVYHALTEPLHCFGLNCSRTLENVSLALWELSVLCKFKVCAKWCRAKRSLTSLFKVSVQVACTAFSDVIMGCTGQDITVRWLRDLTRLFFCRYVTNIPLVILALVHRTCCVELRVGSVSGSPVGNARTVCVLAISQQWVEIC